MKYHLGKDISGSKKYPLHEVAVILCARCKERYQLAPLLVLNRRVDQLVCPRCHNRITFSPDQPALGPSDQGRLIGQFTFPLTLTHDLNHQLNIHR